MAKTPAHILRKIENAKLNNLTALDLSDNQLTEIPEAITKLTNLTTLNLIYNQLTEMPEAITKLTNLTSLYLSDNQLTEMPEAITKLTNLTTLDLSGNQLIEIPEAITKLTNLTELYLSSNQLTEIPEAITKLTNLTELYLSSNQLIEIPEEIAQLTNLEDLYLRSNQLTEIPEAITKLTNLTTLYLRGNPITTPPPEIVNQGVDAIFEYFRSLEKEEKKALNEAKVLLVGDGGAGKTCLVKQLLGEGFNPHELQTDGINISDWYSGKGKSKIKLRLWDFGGQEIMHATHQFFLSKRSLYVLVLDGRKEEDAEYWLKHIESFGGNSPILVVINKIDENPGFDINRRFLLEKYKGVQGFHRISCATGEGINEFKKAIRDSLKEVEIIKTTMAKSWFTVKTFLEKLTDPFISLTDYRKVCHENKITHKISQETLVDFLNDLGIIVHFKDFELTSTHVLNPEWITGAVYKIINSNKLADNYGLLKLDSLDTILEQKDKNDFDYPAEKYPYIVNLMKKFELCFKVNKNEILVPDLLNVQEPAIKFNEKTALKFIFEFDFLPKSILLRFIVKMHRDIKEKLCWRTGVVLYDDMFKSTALIREDKQAKRIYIYVNGGQKQDYLSVIRFTFLSIISDFEKLKFTERVPLPDNQDVAVSYDHLIVLENKGTAEFTPEGSEKSYSVKDLLGRIIETKISEDELLQILKKIEEQLTDKESLVEQASSVLKVQPGIFGVSVDVSELIKKLYAKRKKRKKSA